MKRSHEQFRRDSHDSLSGPSVAATLRKVQSDSEPDYPSDDWQLVTRKSKKPKSNGRPQSRKKSETKPEESHKKKDNRPSLTFAPLHKLNSSIKISDLQNLVLYCLADGYGPQWVSVGHHGQIRKAVVIMIPGLESGMLTGEIKLEENPSEHHANSVNVKASDQADAGSVAPSSSLPAMSCHDDYQKSTRRNPDDFLPVNISTNTLPMCMKPLANIFDQMWPVKAPGDDKYYKLHSPLHAMLTAPIPKSQEDKREEKNIKGAKPVRSNGEWRNERTEIIQYLATKEDLLENDYILHPVCFEAGEEREQCHERRLTAKTTELDGWRDTIVASLDEGTVPESEVEKGSITVGRSILALDCEMCIVDGGESALTRVSIVAWDGEVVMDEFVKPEKPITDYLTPYSGITPKALEGVTTSLSDIQTKVLELFRPRTILVGHSLDSDLKALKITHPFIIDTSIAFPHPRGPPLKSSLKWLVQKYLSREIQQGTGTSGHDSIEDARVCLDLIKQKCEKGPKWGSTEVSGEPIFKRLSRTPKSGSSAPAGGAPRDGKTGAIVDRGAPERGFGGMAGFCIGCKDDAAIVDGVKRAVSGDPDGAYIPGGGVDFTWARMQELAATRHWLNDNRFSSSPDSPLQPKAEPSPAELNTVVKATVDRIAAVWEALPPCTLFIVYSGTGDPREMARLQEMQKVHRREYKTKKWDDLSVRWTDVEEQALRNACRVARAGVGFVALK